MEYKTPIRCVVIRTKKKPLNYFSDKKSQIIFRYQPLCLTFDFRTVSKGHKNTVSDFKKHCVFCHLGFMKSPPRKDLSLRFLPVYCYTCLHIFFRSSHVICFCSYTHKDYQNRRIRYGIMNSFDNLPKLIAYIA